MPDFFDYDPLTKTTQYFDYDDATGTSFITYQQDISKVAEYTQQQARDGATDGGIKDSWWLYAKIPLTIMLKMRKKGINIFNKDHQDRVIAEINTFYPFLKTTEKHHGKTVNKLYGV